MQARKKSVKGKYSHYSTAILLKAFQEGPERISESINGLTLEDLKAKPIAGKWSILEIIIHLAEAEIFGASRFRLAYCLHKGPLPFYNESVLAERLNYQEQSMEFLSHNITLFKLLRNTTNSLLVRLTHQDWQIEAEHPERGKMTIRELLELYADHSERHLEQVLERRALLKKPLPIEIILKDRLY